MYNFLRTIKRKLFKYLGLSGSNSNTPINKFEYWQNKKRAKIYDYQTSKLDYNTILNQLFVDHVEEYINKSSKILDVGAGTGVVSSEISKRGYDVTAADISKEMLEHISKKNQNIRIIQGDVFKIMPNSKFDCVVSRWFVPHFKNWPTLISHISKNVLNKDGYLIFDMPQEEHVVEAGKKNFKISPEIFGYDHSPNASESHYYSMSSLPSLEQIAELNNLQFIARIPHGIFKSNLLLANSIGEQNFNKFNNYISRIGQEEEGREFFYFFEKYIASKIQNHLSHGAILVFRKK
jgi:ubiquinone/menaquinone biosynthesis C-methylase UbiE